MTARELDISGIEHWIPISLDPSVEQREADIRSRMPDADPDTREIMAALAQRALIQGSQGGSSAAVALWARYGDDDSVPLTLATLTQLSAPSLTAGEVATALYADVELARPLEQSEVETASGPATLLSALPVVPNEQGDGELFAQFTVIWIGAGRDEVLTLSATTDDMVFADQLKTELAQLAAGVRGFA